MIWLPPEILEHILCNLDYRTVIECCLVNMTWYTEITSLNRVWREMCTKNNITISDTAGRCCQDNRCCQVASPQQHVTSPQQHVASPDCILNEATYYRDKIKEMLRRCREFNMKGYSFNEEIGPLDVHFISSNSSYIVVVHGTNELLCIDNVSWNMDLRRDLKHADTVLFLETSDSFVVVGHSSGYVTVYDTCGELHVLYEFRVRLAGVKCVKIHDSSRTIAILCGNDVTVIRERNVLFQIQELGSFNWYKVLWDGRSPKDGIFDNVLQFLSDNQIVLVSTRRLFLLQIAPITVTVISIDEDHADCDLQGLPSRKCYFWPSVLLSDKYICCRTSCSVRLYDRQTNRRTDEQTLQLLKVFPRQYSPNERLIFPSDRANLVGIGSKFLIAVDTHAFPRILVFDTETGTLISTIGDDRNECDAQLPIYHGIYHMSYFVRLPSVSWLNGDFAADVRPCLITYKHRDYISDSSLLLFHLESFTVRCEKNQEFYKECSKTSSGVPKGPRLKGSELVSVNG